MAITSKWVTKEILESALKNRSTSEAAILLNVNRNSLSKLRRKYNIPLDMIAVENARIEGSKKGYAAALAHVDNSQQNNPNWKGGISKNHYHYKKIQVARYPDHVNARQQVYRALKRGLLVKQPCVQCGKEKSFAHHEDYSKPLEVIWLCRNHHREVHDNKF